MTAFAAVADRKSFSSAARHLKMSAPAVTRLIAGLEDHLGVALLRRTTRTVAVTDAGARYLERVKRILAETEEAESAAQAELATPSGRLVISAPVTFGRMHISPLVADFLKDHPQVSAELMLSDRYLNLVDDGIDVALRIGELGDSSLIARRAGATRRVVVGSPGYLAARGKPKHPRDLLSHACLRARFSGGATPTWDFERNGEVVRVDPPAALVVRPASAAELAISAAIAGVGIVHLWEGWLRPHLDSGALEPVLQSWWQSFPGPFLYYPGRRHVPVPLRTFVDFIRSRS